MDGTTLTIGQLAEAAGVHLETVRYYERRGLLPEPPRSAAGYRLYGLDDVDRLRLITRAKALGFTVVGDALDSSISPHGYRLLSKVPRLPGAIIDRLIEHFGSLQRLLAANLEDLMEVEGVGEGRARLVREGLSRLAETSILERYV